MIASPHHTKLKNCGVRPSSNHVEGELSVVEIDILEFVTKIGGGVFCHIVTICK
jgi:hypothetical protein